MCRHLLFVSPSSIDRFKDYPAQFIDEIVKLKTHHWPAISPQLHRLSDPIKGASTTAILSRIP
jgi:hypothetical protein